MDLDAEIQDKLGFRIFKKLTGSRAGGCINEGEAYDVDDEKKVFVKRCTKANACQLIAGEMESLETIEATSTVRVPHPLCTVYAPDASCAVIVLEYMSLSPLKSQQQLGEQLALLHAHNDKIRAENEASACRIGMYENNADSPYVTSFGFDVTTCCGSIPMNNDWMDDWESFFARNRLAEQMSLIEENYADRECTELWSKLQLHIPQFFKDFHESGPRVRPSLLHGDLWSGNAGESDGGPAVFDPAAFYGHSEFDLAIGKMFGGFNRSFYTAYYGHDRRLSVIAERRQELYQLFHDLNHWNHFGSGYRDQSLNLMRKLNLMFK